MNLPFSLIPFLQALFTCFRPGYKCPRVSGLQVVSATRNHCPLAVRFRGGGGIVQCVESNGIGWIFLSTFVSREEGGKGKGRWLASLSLDLVDSFIRGERRFEEG